MTEETLSDQEIHVLVRAACFECGRCHGAVCFTYNYPRSARLCQEYEELLRKEGNERGRCELPPATFPLGGDLLPPSECPLCGTPLLPWVYPPASGFKLISAEDLEEHYHEFWHGRDMTGAQEAAIVRAARATIERDWE